MLRLIDRNLISSLEKNAGRYPFFTRKPPKKKFTKRTLAAIFAAAASTLLTVKLLGKPPREKDGKPKLDKFSHLPIWQQYFHRSSEELKYYTNLLRQPTSGKLLPDKNFHPFHHLKYTLILEFTDVLVHRQYTSESEWRYVKRPGVNEFLETVGNSYEIVIYTAEQASTVFPVIAAMDIKNNIRYKLVQNSTIFEEGRHMKDLGNLNRDLSKVLVVDWDPNSTKNHPNNVLTIPRWDGDDNDVTLTILADFLLAIAKNDVKDVRDVVKQYSQYRDPLAKFREMQKRLIEIAESRARDDPKSIQNDPKVWLRKDYPSVRK